MANRTRRFELELSFFLVVALVAGALDVRLANGPTESAGRLEVYSNGSWLGVCSNGFYKTDANVICAQLGYASAQVVQRQAQLFYGSSPNAIVGNFSCFGNETDLSDCPGASGFGSEWSSDECTDTAGVQCLLAQPSKPSSLPVRLACPLRNANGSCKVCPNERGPSPKQCAAAQPAVEGVVQVFLGGEWRAVAPKGWNLKDATVVCGELGYPLALGIPSLQELWPNFDGSLCRNLTAANRTTGCDGTTVAENDRFRDSLRSVCLQTVKCTGTETRLVDCYFPTLASLGNPSLSVATVRCGYQLHPSCLNETIRLRGGPVPWAGRVEVKLNGRWGTVCDSGWNLLDASVACRALGYGSASAVTSRAYYGRGVDSIHLTNTRCVGNEGSLAMCSYQSGLVAGACGHSRDAGVICNAPSSACFKAGSRLITAPDANNLNQSRSFLQLNGPAGWGLLCYATITSVAIPTVACREAKGMFAYNVQKGSASSYQGVRYVGILSCQGSEASMTACVQHLFSVSRCPSGDDATITCISGLPDLVPDVNALYNSLVQYPYIDSLPLYSITCGLEDNCLASSAKTKSPNDLVRVLRFSTQVMNWGTYDFVPSLPPYLWIWHACHNHYHSIEALSAYSLYNASTGLKVAEGHKASFCLEDTVCSSDGGQKRYFCNLNAQGISPNCGDVYARYLDCQWIDISDVPPGEYVLELLINPQNSTMESDYKNNAARCKVRINTSAYFTVLSCSLSDH